MKRFRFTLTVLLGLTFLLVGVSASAATLLVGPGETYTTIQAAVDASVGGDTIVIADGTYTEDVTIVTSLTLEAALAADPIVDGAILIWTEDVVTIDGLTVHNGSSMYGGTLGGIIVAGSGHTIKNCTLVGDGTSQYRGIHVAAGSFNNLTIEDNEISGWFGGIYLNPSSGHQISGNNIHHNMVGIGSDGISNVDITGNIFSDHSAESWCEGMGISAAGVGVNVSNNQFLNNSVSFAHYGGETVAATPNWWGDVYPANDVSGDATYYPCWDSAAMTTQFPTALTVDAGWTAFVIRENSTEGAPNIWGNNNYAPANPDAVEFSVFAGNQKAGLGTDMINGATVAQIASLHIDRLDDVVNSGSLYGPYFNIWVTDGLGHYAVIANEPSDGEWAASRWDVPDWDYLKTKRCKVYEVTGTSGGQPGTSWVFDHTGIASGLVFEDVGDLIIEAPPVAYIEAGNGVGSGAPDVLGTNEAYGFNWIFGDTAANYVTGSGEGFVVDGYSVAANFPVHNVTQDTYFGAIQAAIDAANPGDSITADAGHYEEQLHITIDNLTITGAGAGATFVDAPNNMPLSFMTSSANYPVVFVDGAVGTTISNLTIDGQGYGLTNYRFVGLGVYNADGAYSNMTITRLRNEPLDGAQHGLGVYAVSVDAVPRTATFTDIAISDIQKNATAFHGAALNVVATRVDCTGSGPLGLGLPAQNGIQFSGGAGGTVADCDLINYYYTDPSWTATGLLIFGDGIVQTNDSFFSSCKSAAYYQDASGGLDGCEITGGLGEGVYLYSTGAKADDLPKITPHPFDLAFIPTSSAKDAISFVINNTTVSGTDEAGSYGVLAYAVGPIDITMTGSTVENFDVGFGVYEAGGVVTGSASGNTLGDNLSAGAYSNTAAAFDARGNDWGDPSGPLHFTNPLGLGVQVTDRLDFTPWIGRTVSVIADLGIDPTKKVMSVDGYGYWEGTPALGVDDDFAAGFEPGCFVANVTAADAEKYSKYGFVPQAIFGREVAVGELYNITYLTNKDTDHVADAPDWFCQFYTDGTAHGWYGERINAEPYFSENLTETPGQWTQWTSEAGQNNRLRFFDSNLSLGSYTDGFLSDMAGDAFYGPQIITLFGLGTGTAWAEGFEGKLDGLTVELISGEKVTFNFISGKAAVGIEPAVSGPISCSDSAVLTFNLTTDAYTPDVFLYDMIVRATSEVSFGTITDLLPFGTQNNWFTPMNNGDGSWTITGSTVGNPTFPITTPGTTPLFSIEFLAEANGVADITFDSVVLRDPANQPIDVNIDGATIEMDCIAPAPVTGITAVPGHNKVGVSWTHDHLDVDHYWVYHGVWYDTTPGVSAYPEYDDLSGISVPARPAAGDLPNPGQGWVRVDGDAVVPPADSFFDVFVQIPDDMQRGVYYYEVFAVDAVGNVSDPALTNDRATNYWLGDVYGSAPMDLLGNGEVDVLDMNELGDAFGEVIPLNDPRNIIDVGPTDDWSRVGIPTTDSVINFEDLMVFAMNFGVAAPAKSGDHISATADLAWVNYGDGRMALRLVEGSGVKGFNVRADVPVHAVTAGLLLDEQSEMTFLRNLGDKLDVSVAVMGTGNGFQGSGDLFVVEADSDIDLSQLHIQVRGADNSQLEVALAMSTDVLLPRVFALHANYPNPFNPTTKISFSLPEAQAVRLAVYGIDGRLVTTLMNETRGPGLHEVIWNGCDDTQQNVASGVYFYRIEAGPYSQVHKMTLMK